MNKALLTCLLAGIVSGCSEKKYILDAYSTMRFETLAVPAAVAGQDLLTVDFISSTQGFVGGNGGTLLSTTDGGQSWQNRSSASLGDVYKLLFTSPAVGWAGTSTGLYRSADGGQNWTRVSYGAIHDLQFVSAQVGYAVGEQNTILRTSNGGTTWTSQTGYNWYPSVELRAVSFSSPDSGIVVGAERACFKTTNGGQSWQRDYTGSFPTTNDVIRYRNGKGVVWVGGPNRAADYDTGFEEKFPAPLPDNPYGITNEAYPITSFSVYGLAQWQDRIVAVGYYSVIRKHAQYATHDSPWVQVMAPDGTTIRQSYRAADFSDANTFFAVGEKGTVSRFHYN